MKVRYSAVAISILFKPAVLIALAAAVSRVAQLSGFGTEVIAPVAGSLSETTGLSYTYAVSLVTGLIAYCVLRVVSAMWIAISDTQRSLSR